VKVSLEITERLVNNSLPSGFLWYWQITGICKRLRCHGNGFVTINIIHKQKCLYGLNKLELSNNTRQKIYKRDGEILDNLDKKYCNIVYISQLVNLKNGKIFWLFKTSVFTGLTPMVNVYKLLLIYKNRKSIKYIIDGKKTHPENE